MKSIVKTTSVILVLLAFSINCIITAFALDAPLDTNLTYRDTGFSVSVPTSLPIYVDSEGVVTTANNAVITNNRYTGIYVNAMVMGTGEWIEVDTPTTLIGQKEYSMNVDVMSDDTIAPMSSVGVEYQVQVSPQKDSFIDTNIAQVLFAIDYTDVTGCNHEETLNSLIYATRAGSKLVIEKDLFREHQHGTYNYCTNLKLYLDNDFTTDCIDKQVYLPPQGSLQLVFECDCGKRYSANANIYGVTDFAVVSQALSVPTADIEDTENTDEPMIPPNDENPDEEIDMPGDIPTVDENTQEDKQDEEENPNITDGTDNTDNTVHELS